MGYKTLLTFAVAGAASEARIRAAAALACDLDALLIGMAAEAVSPLVMADPYGAQAGQLMYEQETKDFMSAKAAFESAATGARLEWRSSREVPTFAMASAARSADLIVMGGAPNRGDMYSTVNVGELIVTAGRPVLVVPPCGGLLSPQRILIAWKDTREGRRAVSDALPFLVDAEEILILAMCAADGERSARIEVDDVAHMLKRHGTVEPKTKISKCHVDAMDTQLLGEAETFHADLVVAGGYGHNRAAEWVLGGVTKSLLQSCERFVFLSH